ncbi:ABC transporter substrate-binding protein [Celeribacter sp. PS-C1]|uniref:ABC transporter substrate-binding protein n=1 Tax=Celeribacter sp. PS-C1 TaxID=2820813 RepID=UPI001C67CCDD|nr:ABC transporter substrate-binding protein [Celeribacter sp. PS-C1]MBW6419236.1 ABC transporter substrate-binding protein [Celeribacter sp. PS-C1]
MLRHLIKLAAIAWVALSAPQAGAQDTVRIAHSTESFAFIPLFTAITSGAFEEEGLDAEIIRTGSGSKTVAAVVGRSADIAIGSTTSVLYARKEGLDLQMIAGLVTQYSSSIVYSKEWAEKQGVTAESSYEEMLAALKGARIATSGPGGGDHIIRHFAKEAGLNPDKDLTIVYLGRDIGVYQAALEEGRIDGLSLSAPAPQIAVRERGAVFAFNTGAGEVEDLDGFLYIVATARGDWVKDNPETAQKLVNAFGHAVTLIRDPEASAAARDKVHETYYADVDKGLFDDIWAEFASGAPESVQITKEALVEVVEFTNAFETDNPMDPAMIDGAFLE